MPKFIYIASTKKGETVEGEIDATNEASVLEYLEKHELFPVSIKALAKQKAFSLNISLFEKVSALDKIIITRNLALMIKAGISISEAVDLMLEDAQKPILKKVFTHAKLSLEKGNQLSEALAAFPRHFSPVFLNLLRAGEASGNLENALMEISKQLKKENDLRKKVTSAMAYPAILITAAFGVIILLVTVVLPRVSKIFAQSHLQLPLVTRILLAISDFVTNHWFASLVLFLGFFFLLYLLKKSKTGSLLIEGILHKTPLVKNLLQKVILARFNSVLYSLLKAGVPIIRALEITGDSLGNLLYKKVIHDMTEQEISKGISFGMALKRRPDYFPRLTTSMIIVGEKSGNLEVMLENLAEFYAEEVDNTLKSLITILEPALLLGVGLIIGTLALSIVIPIYQLIGTVR